METTNRTPEYLDSTHPGDLCFDPLCAEAVKPRNDTGRYYITMGHPGFNSPANNRDGYVSQDSARSAIRRYGRRGGR